MTADTSDLILKRMMSLHPKVMDLTLDRVWRLLDRLGNPQDNMPPVIHIAGTNGKGSTHAMLRAGFEGDGKRVHAYTSPHLVRFHERIRLAGSLISEPDLTTLLDECYDANLGEPITYFEITTCAALLAFSRVPADYTLLEVGLGGRLDATNVIKAPRATVITPVSMDHEAFLGDTLGEIAFEKSGILKPEVPAIIARQEDTALEVIERQAARVGAPLACHGQQWHVWDEAGRLVFQDENGLRDLPLPRLRGAHQIQNAGTALAVLRQELVSDKGFDAAMTQAEWPARMQLLSIGKLAERCRNAELWLDGGHNPAAGEALANTLSALPDRPVWLICGMLNSKQPDGFLAHLKGQCDALIGVDIPGEINSLSAGDMADAARDAGINGRTADSVETALDLITDAAPGARIVICGSLYLAGHVLRINEAPG